MFPTKKDRIAEVSRLEARGFSWTGQDDFYFYRNCLLDLSAAADLGNIHNTWEKFVIVRSVYEKLVNYFIFGGQI